MSTTRRKGLKETVHENGTLLTILTAVTILLAVYSMPFGRTLKYEFSEGYPWMYDELIAPYDFSIEKSDEDYQKEVDSLRNSFLPYFAMDEETGVRAIAAFGRLFEDTLSKVVSPTTFRRMTDRLSEIYSAGILDSEGERILESRDYLKSYSGNNSRLVNKESVFTLKTAYQHLTENNIPASVLELDFDNFIAPNLKYDSDRSEADLKEREEQISRFSGRVVANQKIVDKGDIVDHYRYQVIKSYVDIENQSNGINFRMLSLGGNLIYVTILTAMLMLYLFFYRKDIISSRQKLLFLFCCVTLFTVCTNLYIRYGNWSIFILPCTMQALMLRIFLDSRTSFICYLVSILISSVCTPMPFEFVLLQTVAGFAAIYSIHELTQRSQIFRAVAIIFCSYCIVWIALQMMQLDDMKLIQWQTFIFFGINCFILLLTYPLVFAIEKLFGFTSNVTLIELSNLNNPLLQQLSYNAPGTFQHSIQVSTLASEAANAIGAKTQLVRTAALYHDIGKLANPPFFTENQNGVNPHDSLSYEQSARIITQHVPDGRILAEKSHLPQDIIHFIDTHHGSGMAKYFYIKYRNEHPGEEADPTPFNYEGPDPDTKETAILMMADAVEASSRSLTEYTEDSIGNLVDRIIDSQVEEGHFTECPITFKEISQVKVVFKEKLKTIYHTRISYPELSR
ncbi:MAG: HDIG domain-containing protein [Bacteroidaceae bacterium]|nr:HDIG domain-containing protein [Bacteroidaceae bacterium]